MAKKIHSDFMTNPTFGSSVLNAQCILYNALFHFPFNIATEKT